MWDIYGMPARNGTYGMQWSCIELSGPQPGRINTVSTRTRYLRLFFKNVSGACTFLLTRSAISCIIILGGLVW